MDYILNIFITQSISRMHFGMYCMQASIPNVHLNDIYSKYERFHVKDKRKKEEIEYIYTKQINKALVLRVDVYLSKGRHENCQRSSMQDRTVPKRSRITRFISTLYAVDESHTHKYFQKFTASSVCCIALISFLILTNWYYLWHCVYVCYTLRTIQCALHSYKVQTYVQPAACLSVV